MVISDLLEAFQGEYHWAPDYDDDRGSKWKQKIPSTGGEGACRPILTYRKIRLSRLIVYYAT